MTLQDLITQYGAYYLGNADNRMRLFKKMYQGNVTASMFRYISSKSTVWQATLAHLKSVVQAYQKAWTPKSDMKFTPHQVQLFHLKIDIEEIPHELEDTWMGFLTELALAKEAAGETNVSIERLAITTWPFVRWYVEEHLMNAKDQDIELNEIFWGQFSEPVANTPNADGTNIDGLRKKILTRRDAVTPLVTSIPTGAIETGATEFVEQIEEFVSKAREAMPRIMSTPMEICMNTLLYDRFVSGSRKLYNQDNTVTDASAFRKVMDKNAIVVGLPSMNANETFNESSELIFMTFAQNRVRPTIFDSNQSMVSTGNNPRALQIFNNWWMAVDFIELDKVFVNELDSLEAES